MLHSTVLLTLLLVRLEDASGGGLGALARGILGF